MNKALNIGVIGCGYWGPRLVRNFARQSLCSVTMACDLQEDRLAPIRADYPYIRTVTKASEMIENADLDCVAIATPVHTHYPLAKAALEAGKHVFLEKPLTMSSSEAEDLVRIAEERNRVLMVDHVFLFTGAVEKIKEIVSSGDLGDILYFDSIRVNLGLFQHDVNVMWDLAPHDLSIMLHLVEKKPVAVSAVGSKHPSHNMEHVAYISVRFDDNTVAHFHVNWLAPVKVRRILVGGESKMLVYDDMETSEKVKVYDKGISISEGDSDALYRALVQYRTGDMWAPRLDQGEALYKEAKYFCECVATGTQPFNDGRAGLEVVRILEKADESLKKGGTPVELI